jgi:hypothetical protein
MDRRGETLQEALGSSRATGRDDDAVVPGYSPHPAEEDGVGKAHAWDRGLDDAQLDDMAAAAKGERLGDLEKDLKSEGDDDENSPYPEVQAAVANTDDMGVPANTVRAWFMGMLFVTLMSALNCFFSLRNPNITIGPLVVQLCSYPVGVFLAYAMPTRVFNLFGLKFSLNPGPFNKKEHALITIMANVAFGGSGYSYSTMMIEAQRGFYNIDWGFGFAIMFTLTTQMIGLGLAGVVGRYLVKPASMIWPSNLPSCAMFNTLHDRAEVPDPASHNGWSISRFRFFFCESDD